MPEAKPDDARELEDGRGLDRMIAFSDGVFAIAITLLVLNFKLPHVSGGDVDTKLRDALYDDWGLWLSYALSFMIVARYWVVHHKQSLLLRRIDQRFIALNLVLLGTVVILPYPTEVLGEYGNRVATVFYALALTVTGLVSFAVWDYAARAGLMDPRITDRWKAQSRYLSLSVPVVFGLSIPLAFINLELAQYSWTLLLFTRVAYTWRNGPIRGAYDTT